MCTTRHLRSRACGHHWLIIAQPCMLGMGFMYCDQFGDGHARDPSGEFVVDSTCPACTFPGRYDKNNIRMILDIKKKWRWGLGPCKEDPGVECTVM